MKKRAWEKENPSPQQNNPEDFKSICHKKSGSHKENQKGNTKKTEKEREREKTKQNENH